MRERLQKVMAECGLGSRRACEQMIRDGRVKVNGQVTNELPVLVDPNKDRIQLGRRRLRYEPKVYYLLNKPKKVVCTNSDPKGRLRAIDLLPRVRQRIYTVGRLDTDSTGLLILTNDGDFANQLTHPRYGVHKSYLVEIDGGITPEAIERLKKGIYLPQGKARMEHVRILHQGPRQSQLEITLHEGRNRQIRVMLLRQGFRVKKLKRIRIGPIELRGLGPGKTRAMRDSEIRQLRELVTRNTGQADQLDDAAEESRPEDAKTKGQGSARRKRTTPRGGIGRTGARGSGPRRGAGGRKRTLGSGTGSGAGGGGAKRRSGTGGGAGGGRAKRRSGTTGAGRKQGGRSAGKGGNRPGSGLQDSSGGGRGQQSGRTGGSSRTRHQTNRGKGPQSS